MRRALIPIVSLLILAFIFGIIFLFSPRYIKVVRAKENVIEIQQKIERLKKENNKLKREVRLLKVPSYIEKVAREELGLVKPGEILFLPRMR